MALRTVAAAHGALKLLSRAETTAPRVSAVATRSRLLENRALALHCGHVLSIHCLRHVMGMGMGWGWLGGRGWGRFFFFF